MIGCGVGDDGYVVGVSVNVGVVDVHINGIDVVNVNVVFVVDAIVVVYCVVVSD